MTNYSIYCNACGRQAKLIKPGCRIYDLSKDRTVSGDLTWCSSCLHFDLVGIPYPSGDPGFHKADGICEKLEMSIRWRWSTVQYLEATFLFSFWRHVISNWNSYFITFKQYQDEVIRRILARERMKNEGSGLERAGTA